MKKIIIISFLIVAIGVKAQVKIKSIAVGDSIVLPKGCYEIKPVIATAMGDTARSMTWCTNQMQRDTLIGFNLNVSLFNKKGAQIAVFGMQMPPLQNVQLYLNMLDNYISQQIKRFVKP